MTDLLDTISHDSGKLTYKEIKRILDYYPDKGTFIWKVRINQGIHAGDVAGCLHHSGYWHIKYKNKGYTAHRLAFLYMTGKIPSVVDHKNRDKSDNRWNNLRAASHAKNQRNCQAYTTNKLGYKGVHRAKTAGKFKAQIRFNGKGIYLGRFDTAEDAAIAYNEKSLELHGEFACLNKIKETI